ncbi:transporter substrate-binding domain-containing protein [Stappia sp. GBMRC 2046]|uniref:Transporter substrate-binding domain-containing protein n=1 Tax=Stappia sediminis TaxID=2692190 RepID=A0A7X3LWG7_9HYPH|nr:transporter substrate-binding domain-containing protein [Stappia sediminis]MXN66399.1 transporter substrate-binding domain-containing protein [Stappia sediminis]
MHKLLHISVFITALMHSFAYSSTAHAAEVKVAARVDAKPFIWKDGETGEFLGFFWDICTEAVQRADFQFRIQEVKTENRSNLLNNGTEGFDLFCDPTTITLQRMKNFSKGGNAPYFEFSPIVFVANGSYVQHDRSAKFSKASGDLPEDAPDPPDCDSIFNWLKAAKNDTDLKEWKLPSEATQNNKTLSPKETDNEQRSLLEWLEDRFAFVLRRPTKETRRKVKHFQIWGYVDGTTIGEAITAFASTKAQEDTKICTKASKTHEEAAKRFCDGEFARYFGDVEIVKAAIATQDERIDVDCKVDLTPTAEGTYEPYAFVLSSKSKPDFPERFTIALYSMFQDGTVDRLFNGHFPKAKKSPHLSTLFRINSIPTGVDRLGNGAQGEISSGADVSQ